MAIDAATRVSLELLETQRGQEKGSLRHEIDLAVTPPGSRLLARRLAHTAGEVTDSGLDRQQGSRRPRRHWQRHRRRSALERVSALLGRDGGRRRRALRHGRRHDRRRGWGADTGKLLDARQASVDPAQLFAQKRQLPSA